jgi:hypothetical protein
MEEDTTLCSDNNFLRSYYIPILGEQMEGCAFSKDDYLSAKKRECISRPLFLDFFFLFQIFNDLEKE